VFIHFILNTLNFIYLSKREMSVNKDIVLIVINSNLLRAMHMNFRFYKSSVVYVMTKRMLIFLFNFCCNSWHALTNYNIVWIETIQNWRKQIF